MRARPRPKALTPYPWRDRTRGAFVSARAAHADSVHAQASTSLPYLHAPLNRSWGATGFGVWRRLYARCRLFATNSLTQSVGAQTGFGVWRRLYGGSARAPLNRSWGRKRGFGLGGGYVAALRVCRLFATNSLTQSVGAQTGLVVRRRYVAALCAPRLIPAISHKTIINAMPQGCWIWRKNRASIKSDTGRAWRVLTLYFAGCRIR